MARRPKQLLVEGPEDLYAVVGLMKHHVSWPDDLSARPVHIEPMGGINKILDRTYLGTKFKESGLDVLGVMIDADDSPLSRWRSFRQICGDEFPSLPNDLPPDGLIANGRSGLRLGFWLMPDCRSSGMIETFLRHMVPLSEANLWAHAVSSFDGARTLGASCRQAHHDKAHIHTWLAWQDPPGERAGGAITRKILDPEAPTALPFVAWFKNLFML